MPEEFTIDSRDMIHKLAAYQWTPKGNPEAVLVIVHGMSEHMMRYNEMAEYLASKGIVVAGIDLLGHGKSVSSKDELGYFCERDAATVAVRDVHRLKKTVQAKYPGVPVFLLGHSMGSFIARCYIERYGTGIQGVLLLGSNDQNRTEAALGKCVIKLVALFHGWHYRSPFVTKLILGHCLDRIDHPESPNEWIVKRKEVLEIYEKDPLSGFIFTLNGYLTLLVFICRAGDPKELAHIPSELPMLIMSGSEDPVGKWGEGVKKLEQLYQRTGLKDIKMILVEGDRHELHNEEDRYETFDRITDFIRKHVV